MERTFEIIREFDRCQICGDDYDKDSLFDDGRRCKCNDVPQNYGEWKPYITLKEVSNG